MASPSAKPESLASLGDFYLLVGTTYQTQASISEPLASLIFHDQDGDAVVFAGGAEGLEEDADPANVSALLATGRASIYVHGLEMAFDSGDASPFNTPSQVLETTSNATSSDAIAQVIQTTGSETNGVLELYETNVSSIATADWNSPWGNYDWQAELTQTGWVPAEATMNLNWGPTGLTTQAEQDALALAQAAQEAGIKTVLPIISPQGLEAGNFATLASDANDRALALQLGGLVIDMPSNYFLDNPGGTYQATAISEIKWAVANDLVVAVLLSPYSETTTGIPQFEYDSTFLSASQQVESILAAAGALPTQWMIENYAPLDGDANPVTGSDPNSINSVATWFAENAPTAPEPSWFIGETSVSNTPQEATATISASRGIAIVASSVVGWLPTDVSSTVEYTLVGSPATVQAALQAVQVTGAGADGGTGKLTVTITDADGNATSTKVAITVDPTAPWNVTTNVTGAVGESVPFSVSGDAGANAEVTLLDGSQVIGTTTADAAGSWNLPSVLLDTVGVHTLSATAEFDGLTSGESQNISVNVYDVVNDPTLDFSIEDAPTNTIIDFVSGDTIDITDMVTTATRATLNATDDVLSIPYVNDGGGTLQLQLDPNGSYNDEIFHLSAASAPLTGTVLTLQATCFCKGTLILTDRGEVPVEALRAGDLVVTRSGNRRPIRWIGRRTFSGIFAAGKLGILPVRIRANALAEGVPRRDLLVSPQHAILVDHVLVPAGSLLNGQSIVQVESVESVIYYHVELDSHDVILAEGAPLESFVDDDSRAMFDNTAEYYALYPDARAEPVRYCAPRVEDGQVLETIRRSLAVRTGVATVPQATTMRETAAGQPSVPRGYVDEVNHTHVRGWAWDPSQADKAVEVELLVNGKVVARVLANRYRGDLHGAAIGDGCHGFEVTIAGGLPPLVRHVIIVRLAEDGILLENATVILEPVTPFDEGIADAVVNAVTGLDMPSEQDRVLSFLAAQMERVLQRRADAEAQRDAREAHRLFRRRWGPAADDATAHLGIVGAPGLRALVIDEELPVADRDAGSQAVLSHIRALRTLGYAVTFVAAEVFSECNTASENDSVIAALEREEIACCRLPVYASVEEVLRRQAGCFDVIYLHRLPNATKYLALARHHCPRARVLFSVADLHHLRLERQARIEKRPDLLAESHRVRLVELMAALSADAVLTHSEDEARLLRQAVPGAAVHVVPWAIETRRDIADQRRRGDERRNGVAFIANYGHEPNLDAARFLAEAIMPLVWRRDPAIACLLAGSRMPTTIRRLARPGRSTSLLILGHVPDLTSVFDSVRLTVAPLRYGAGVKGKVLASFAVGLPCVMTPIAAEGMDLPDILSACVGNSAPELADLILHLHHDVAARQTAGLAGLAMVESRFAESRVAATLKAAIDGRERPRPTLMLPRQAAIG